jgi:hypothetical protein
MIFKESKKRRMMCRVELADKPRGHGDAGGVGGLDGGRVLARQQASGVNRLANENSTDTKMGAIFHLALCEQEWLTLSGSLLGCEPLDGRSIGRSLVLDAHGNRFISVG